MKKTTKFLLVLAAVVAMTIGAVSTVMAAELVYAEIPADGWSKDIRGNDIAKDVNGKDVASGWALSAAGHWYYFENKSPIVNKFIKWDGEYYYFGKDGIMCEGWVKFTAEDAEVLEGVGLDYYDTIDGFDILENVKDNPDNNPYNYYVWMFFQQGGTAALDEWIEDEGMYYYFEETVMIQDTYVYEVDDKIYGFSGDGNMHVGWVPVIGVDNHDEVDPTNLGNNEKNIGWTYYDEHGVMVDAGWEKLGEDWFYFVPNKSVIKDGEEASRFMNAGVSAGTMLCLQNTWAEDDADGSGSVFAALDVDHKDSKGVAVWSRFFFDADGYMVRGEYKIGKKVGYVNNSADDFLSGTYVDSGANNEGWYFFDKTTGVQLFGEVEGSYYAKDDADVYVISDDNIAIYTVRTENTEIKFDEDYAFKKSAIEGERVYNAFVVTGGNAYYCNANGKIVKSDVIDFYGVTVGLDKDGKLVKSMETNGKEIGSRLYYFNKEFGIVTVGSLTGIGTHDDSSAKYTITLDAMYTDKTDLTNNVSISAKKAVYGSVVTIKPLDATKVITGITGIVKGTNVLDAVRKEDGSYEITIAKSDIAIAKDAIQMTSKNYVGIADTVKGVSVDKTYTGVDTVITVSATSGKEITELTLSNAVNFIDADGNKVNGTAVTFDNGELKVGGTVISTDGKVKFAMPNGAVTISAATVELTRTITNNVSGIIVDKTSGTTGETVQIYAPNDGKIVAVTTSSVTVNGAITIPATITIDAEVVSTTGAAFDIPSGNVTIKEALVVFDIVDSTGYSLVFKNTAGTTLTEAAAGEVVYVTHATIGKITALEGVSGSYDTTKNAFKFTMPAAKVEITDITVD